MFSSPWKLLGFITIDTARLLLIDPMHVDFEAGGDEAQQIAIPGGDFSAVAVGTGMGDGRYRVEGRYADSPFGRRLAEIRVRFLDKYGNWMGADTVYAGAGMDE
jgi:hypothetical protein